MKRQLTYVAAITLSLGLAAGCASGKSKVVAPNAAANNAPAQGAAPESATTATTGAEVGIGQPVPVSPNLAVSSAIARACHLAVVRANPEFAFDSADIVAEDKELLASLAKCMSEGALKGKSVELTGRTDNRGESEYNMSLGENRADSVKRYLHDLGVGDPRLHSTSRGEMDATGNDESSYTHDRRVDIDLVN